MARLKESTTPLTYILKWLFFLVLIGAILWYFLFQARNLLLGPNITLDSIETEQSKRRITLTGTTENITEFTLNGKPIFTDEEGTFEKALVLENGYTIMTLRAKDRFGRTVSLSKPFVYKNDE